jgi:hypothetical protein
MINYKVVITNDKTHSRTSLEKLLNNRWHITHAHVVIGPRVTVGSTSSQDAGYIEYVLMKETP